MSGVPTIIRTCNRSRFARQGPQPADLGLVLGTPGEVVAAVCRSVCLQVLGIAGLEFVCVFGHDAFEYFDHTGNCPAQGSPLLRRVGTLDNPALAGHHGVGSSEMPPPRAPLLSSFVFLDMTGTLRIPPRSP